MFSICLDFTDLKVSKTEVSGCAQLDTTLLCLEKKCLYKVFVRSFGFPPRLFALTTRILSWADVTDDGAPPQGTDKFGCFDIHL